MKMQNRVAWLFAALSLMLVTAGSRLDAENGWTSLWNGKNLDGWTTWIDKPHRSVELAGLRRDGEGRYLEAIGSGRDPLGIFTVVPDVDGRPAIRISGQVFGELRTKRAFQNYHLRLQFKWGLKKWPPRDGATTARDSGLLYHVHAAPGAEGRTWARSIELQIQEHDVGDLYAIGSVIAVRAKPQPATQPPVYQYDPGGVWTYFSQSPGSAGRCVKQPDSENPSGEWNTIELIAFGKDAIHVVNGKVVMRLHDPTRIDLPLPASVTSGPIILQSEGAEVFYRDIQVRPIRRIPSEFAVR